MPDCDADRMDAEYRSVVSECGRSRWGVCRSRCVRSERQRQRVGGRLSRITSPLTVGPCDSNSREWSTEARKGCQHDDELGSNLRSIIYMNIQDRIPTVIDDTGCTITRPRSRSEQASRAYAIVLQIRKIQISQLFPNATRSRATRSLQLSRQP